MSATIYAVNSGCYSDYRVVALFTSREKADAFMAAVPDGDYNTVEEYELDPPTADLIRRGYSCWLVRMDREGNTDSVERKDIDAYSATSAPSVWRRSTAPAYRGQNLSDLMTGYFMAKTEKAAVKIANERRVQMIANGEWEPSEASR